jgi:hypothetical protein
MTDIDDTPGTPDDTPAASPEDQALAAAVPGARGWFRYEGGAVNVRSAGAVTTPQWDDQLFRVIVAGQQGSYDLGLGPYDDGTTAAGVADAMLRLAYDDAAWPTA